MKLVLGTYSALKGKAGFPATFLRFAPFKLLKVFPVPGIEVLMKNGFDPYQKKVELASTPRHANVLLVAGPIPETSEKAAAIAFAQMPRPRMLVFMDVEQTSFLPKPDMVIHTRDLKYLSNTIHPTEIYAENTTDYKPAFLIEALSEEEENDGHQHHHGGHDHDGYDHDGHDHRGSHDHREHDQGGSHDHREHDHSSSHDHSEHDHGSNHDHNGHDQGNNHVHEGHDHGGSHDHGEHDQGNNHDHNGHDHGSGGFMSMVMMTKDLPRGTDGLQMDRNEVRFGPFHPGLPGGLQVKMTLSGDTVARAEVEKGLFDAGSFENFPKEPKDFPGWLAGLDPFQIKTYNQLAHLALAKAANSEFHLNIRELEKERIQNLLLWLMKFQITLGDRQMERQVFQLWEDFQQNKLSLENFEVFRKKIKRRWYLKSRLRRMGRLPEEILHHYSGPVTKAAGNAVDLREGLEEYKNFKGFQLEENNAWGWLLARLEEISFSLKIVTHLVPANGKEKIEEIKKLNFSGSQHSYSKLETSRGVVILKLEMAEDKIKKVELKRPSVVLAAAVPQITENYELADALVTIAALDISPWEINE